VSLRRTFGQQLTANLQAQVVAEPDIDIANLQPTKLTLAEYELDGTLNVGEITLTPQKSKNRIFFAASGLPEGKTRRHCVSCELVSMRVLDMMLSKSPSLG
jgi:hypothetical protein